MSRIGSNPSAPVCSPDAEDSDASRPPAPSGRGPADQSNTVDAFEGDGRGRGAEPRGEVCETPPGSTVTAAQLMYGRGSLDGLVPAGAASSAQQNTCVPPPELKEGHHGPSVAALQRGLREAGVPCALDGGFGPGTAAAVRAFQAKCTPPLPQTGVVDAATWEQLQKAAPRALSELPTQPPLNKGEYDIGHTPDKTPMYVQGDARWGKVNLGNSQTNIATAGCLVSSIAMSLSQRLGRDVRPDELNAVLTKHHCFVGDTAKLDPVAAGKAIEAEYGIPFAMDIAPRDSNLKYLVTGRQIAQTVDEELAAGRQVIVNVDTDANGTPNHFVVVQRKEGDDYIVLDPALGRAYRYGMDADGNLVAREPYYPHANPNDPKHPNYNAPKVLGYVVERGPSPAARRALR